MEVDLAKKDAPKKGNWAILGGAPLPIVNPNLFSNGEIKLAKVRPKLVVDVPPNEDEKRVKVSRIPVVLKYLKNNWIWHSKNGLEKNSSAKKASSNSTGSQNAAEIDARDRMRYRRFQTALRNAANADGQNGEEAEEDAAALELVEEEIERTEMEEGGPCTSKAASNNSAGELLGKSLEEEEMGMKAAANCSKIVSMAARAMEEEEEEPMEMEKQPKQHFSPSPSSSSSSAPPMIIRRRKVSGGGKQRRMPMDEEEEEEMDGQKGKKEFGEGDGGGHSPPPAKLGRNC